MAFKMASLWACGLATGRCMMLVTLVKGSCSKGTTTSQPIIVTDWSNTCKVKQIIDQANPGSASKHLQTTTVCQHDPYKLLP